MDWLFCNKVTFISFLVFSFCIFSHERKRFLKWLLLGGQSSRNRISLCFTILFSVYIGKKYILNSYLISKFQQLHNVILNFSLSPRLNGKIKKYLMKQLGLKCEFKRVFTHLWVTCWSLCKRRNAHHLHFRKKNPKILLFLNHPVLQVQLENTTWKARN